MSVEASVSTSASSDDIALTEQIAPAMLEKLKRDGKDRGHRHGSDLLMVSNMGLLLLLLNPDWHPEFLGWFPILLVAAFAAWLVLPWYFSKRSVAAELTYRRRHGKWRWER
jgi:hypothetical protein